MYIKRREGLISLILKPAVDKIDAFPLKLLQCLMQDIYTRENDGFLLVVHLILCLNQ